MSVLQAAILGAVQGFTSFFPVSSSGHVLLVGRLLGIQDQISLAYVTILHTGTLIAVVLTFFQEIIRMASELFRMLIGFLKNIRILFTAGKQKEPVAYHRIIRNRAGKTALLLLAAVVPTIIAGFVLRQFALNAAANLLFSGAGLMITALLLFVSSFRFPKKNEVSGPRFRDAFVIGLAQGGSVFPGISRFGTVYAVSGICGLSAKNTFRFAVFLSVPSVVGALVLNLEENKGASLQSVGGVSCLVGIIVSALAGIVSLHLASGFFRKKRNRGFALYCLILGILSIVISFAG